ncbi:hypothetical protein DPX16_5631 [Anabarilius grahami]|uniref:Uncharacterized protein n=1 Tax=Anabarilius grahami TaxID=495550 RepID=A0A3N0YPW3_ANAGA|nr:hypothetical protein DPX16_5631 [Anabarilius grahami]
MDHSASALNNSSFHPLKHLCVGVVALHAIRARDQTLQPSALMMGRYKTDPRAGSAPLVLLQPDACLLHGSLCFCSGNQGGKPGHRVFRAEESTFSSSVFMSKEDSTASRRPVLVGNPAGPRRDPLKGYRRRGRAGPVEAIAAGDVESKLSVVFAKASIAQTYSMFCEDTFDYQQVFCTSQPFLVEIRPLRQEDAVVSFRRV